MPPAPLVAALLPVYNESNAAPCHAMLDICTFAMCFVNRWLYHLLTLGRGQGREHSALLLSSETAASAELQRLNPYIVPGSNCVSAAGSERGPRGRRREGKQQAEARLVEQSAILG